MYNLHYSGSSNNFKAKPKPQNNNTIYQNKKLNQYLEKNRKIHKSPVHTLNKSQNISAVQSTFNTNIKNKIINNGKAHLHAKKIFPLQNFKNIQIANKNNYSIKISSIHYQNNSSISKNNSLSNYLTKTNSNMNKNLRRNNTNSKIMNKTNNTNYNTSNINIHLNNNSNSNYHQNNSNLFYLKKDV